MDMSGEYRISAPRQMVWEALNSEEALKACIPGCEELEKTSDNGFTATVVPKIGPVKAKFNGEGKCTVTWLDPKSGDEGKYTFIARM